MYLVASRALSSRFTRVFWGRVLGAGRREEQERGRKFIESERELQWQRGEAVITLQAQSLVDDSLQSHLVSHRLSSI